MADELIKDVDPIEVTPTFEDEEFKIEIIDEEKEPGDKSDEKTLALEAKIAEMEVIQKEYKEKLENAPASPDVSMAALTEALKNIGKQEPTKPVEAQTDFKALFESIDKNFYNSPSKGVVDVVTPLMQSLDKKYSDVATQQAVNISKLTVLADDTQKGDYIKYKDEVDRIVNASPPSENVYGNALKQVRSLHFDDILAEKVAAQVAILTTAAEEAAKASLATAQASPGFTNATHVQQARAQNSMKITANQQLVASKWAVTKGYDWNDPEEKKWVLTYLKTNGVI